MNEKDLLLEVCSVAGKHVFGSTCAPILICKLKNYI